MIELTRLNGVHFFLNAELVEQVEAAPDTVITLTTGNNFVVREPVDVVIDRIISYRRSIGVQASSKKDRLVSGTVVQ